MRSFAAVSVLTLLTTLSLSSAQTNCAVQATEDDYGYNRLGSHRPSKWGSVKGYETCSEGNSQSPIDFPLSVSYASPNLGPDPVNLGGMMFLEAKNENWALECKEPGTCGYTSFAGLNFSVVNVHFHSPSEHTLNGAHYPLESHIVHASDDGRLAVISTMFKFVVNEGYYDDICNREPIDCHQNPLLQSIFSSIDSGKEEFSVNIASMINKPLGYCSYLGSLTTPPCTEGVTWLLANEVQIINARQVHRFNVSAGGIFDGNNRPVQTINNREVVCFM